MELVTVGTGTVAPSASRTAACHWVSRGRLKILLDCGAGALHRLAEFGLPWQQVTHVVPSHFHPDHWGELPMLVYALKYTTAPPREEPLVILGPPGVVRLVKALAEGYGPWLLDPGFPIGILDIRDGEPFPLDAEVNLETFPVPHTPESVALAVAAPGGGPVHYRRSLSGADRDAARRHRRGDSARRRRHRRTGLQGQPDAGRATHRRRAGRQRRPRGRVAARGAPGRAGDHPRLEAV